MGIRVKVAGVEALDAAALLMKNADAELATAVRKHTQAIGDPDWQEAVRGRTTTALEVRTLADTAKLLVAKSGVTLRSAATKRPLSGGLVPSQNWPAVEFGNWPEHTKTYTTRSRKGRSYEATRHTARQLKPKTKSGHVVYPAAAAMIPRIAALWAQTVVRTVHEMIEGK